jgi:hypothetical protein
MQLQQAEEYERLGGGYFFNEGCMAHNCLTRAFTVTDATGAHGTVGMLDCALSDTGEAAENELAGGGYKVTISLRSVK